MKLRAGLVTLLFAVSAEAQIHWDASLDAGVQKRFLSQTISADASFGPTFGLRGHVALLPFVRVGAYGTFDVSPLDRGPSAPRLLFAAGVEGKIFSPFPSGDLRLFLSLGFGYVGAVAPGGHTITLRPRYLPGMSFDAKVDGSGGGFAELPIGVGASYKLRSPWSVYAMLQTRIGFAFWGTLYGESGGRNAKNETLGNQAIGFDGYDVASLGLVVGVTLDK